MGNCMVSRVVSKTTTNGLLGVCFPGILIGLRSLRFRRLLQVLFTSLHLSLHRLQSGPNICDTMSNDLGPISAVL